MFTGIVEAQGRIAQAVGVDKGQRLLITGSLDLSDARLGDSIAVDGVCLTVTSLPASGFTVDVSQETLDCTAGFHTGQVVNLEKTLRFGDRLGGHLVSGHVDGVGHIEAFESIGENRKVRVRVPSELRRYIARKGSVTLNGVSLTVNEVEGDTFELNLIPHTLSVTNLQALKSGSPVNIEVDLLARYVEGLLKPAQG
ncbi:MAG: riboflavin synthase [Betaproteobacteria bacterium]|nr:riboflavin synthase [Betaproteobacteria bacterium]